jgi:hypothetical protein
VHRAERPAEVARAGETPPGGDSGDRPGGQRRIGEVVAAAVKPLLLDPAGHGQALVVEELLQGAQRHVVGGGDHGRAQPGVTQVPEDEGLHLGELRVPAGLGRVPVLRVQLVRQPGREDLERGSRQARRLGRAVVIDVAGQLEEELRGHRAQAGTGAEPYRDEFTDPLARQRQQGRREHERHHVHRPVLAGSDDRLVGTPGVVEGELPGRQPCLPAVLLDHAGIVPAYQGQLQHVRVGLRDVLGSAAHHGRRDVDDHDLHRPEAAGAELGAVIAALDRETFHGHPRLGHDLAQEIDEVGRGHLVGLNQRAHRWHLKTNATYCAGLGSAHRIRDRVAAPAVSPASRGLICQVWRVAAASLRACPPRTFTRSKLSASSGIV